MLHASRDQEGEICNVEGKFNGARRDKFAVGGAAGNHRESKDLAHVKRYTTDDFTYVSLNYEHAPLKKIMPWAGTTAGAEALVQTFIDVGRFWRIDDFTIEDSF